MAGSYNQIKNGNTNVHFTKAMFGEVESSRMTATPQLFTTFNAGDLVPIYCREILPDESISMDMDFVIRQTTLLTPTMGSMHVDLYAFFVPNRIVNTSWKAVEGENYSGSWTSNPVSLAPLVSVSTGSTQVPVGSVADYYGFPTQQPIPNSVLSLCHDLKFRGYVMIWNEWFRDQNYQPPIPISYLNVFQGFFVPDRSTGISLTTTNAPFDSATYDLSVTDGSFGAGSVGNVLYGSSSDAGSTDLISVSLLNRFNALSSPLKVNKLHDYFTSVLPSPQKSNSSVMVPATGSANIPALNVLPVANFDISGSHPAMRFREASGGSLAARGTLVNSATDGSLSSLGDNPTGAGVELFPSNLATLATSTTLTGVGVDIADIRMASAIQQLYEILGRGGSRYREQLSSLFGLEVDDPFDDVPKCLGHISRDLDLFQTAQTAASESGSTPQGNLAAFGYTSTGGHLFTHRFIEHGYLHIFAVVRHRNIYSSFMARDNFRLSMLDFYTPPLANISEQPVYSREINPFSSNPNGVFGYQEAWAEYRYEPDQVSGYMRPGVTNSLSIWDYADDFDSGLQISNAVWLRSNSQQILDRTLAVTSSVAPQFKAQFLFKVNKTLPMPIYSVPGMDII